jgi:hypothetical protein
MSNSQDEGRLLYHALNEVGHAYARVAARNIAIAVGLTFLAAWVTGQFAPSYALVIFLFGPMLVAHAFWLWRTWAFVSAKRSVDALPLWERHRLTLLLKSADEYLTAKRAEAK